MSINMWSLSAVLLLALVNVVYSNTIEFLDQWEAFKEDHNKQYVSEEDEQLRMNIFLQHAKEVVEHNRLFEQGLVSYSQQLYGFLDRTPEEMARSHFGLNLTLSDTSTLEEYAPTSLSDLPSTKDWRRMNVVTEVKNQKECGSCWAFAVVGTVEGAHAQKTDELVSLSAQNLVDCMGEDTCETGGDPIKALQYVKLNGIEAEDSYPYEGENKQCRFKPWKVGAVITGFKIVVGEQALMHAVATKGPVTASIHVTDSWKRYKSGVHHEHECKNHWQSGNHGVLVVGYGTDPNGGDYWLVKNSWGSDWGENGYIRMARNSDNQCGIASRAMVALV